MKFGIIVFPGSSGDLDAYHLIKDVLDAPVEYIWHEASSVQGFDCLILPGGFSYGNYLRGGALASCSPIIPAVVDFARRGGLVLGIANGFQVLTEAGLLPGALYTNADGRFHCHFTTLRVENTDTPFTRNLGRNQLLSIPIAHGEGNYYVDPATLQQLEESGQIVFRYTDEKGQVTAEANPNGSVGNIAGVCNETRNVLGMMAHPERAGEAVFGSIDGLALFNSILKYWEGSK
ncbi:MAG TPA: phosphoribosylformylglycinamidine synthase subunit PurQ [Firmicutes bacterium]|jgi:phosphoribosylformylglycinamidine synthase I|nr:phosphoribosylformylglycinamidine synthase subunit PurQ [Bacillota bacterium]